MATINFRDPTAVWEFEIDLVSDLDAAGRVLVGHDRHQIFVRFEGQPRVVFIRSSPDDVTFCNDEGRSTFKTSSFEDREEVLREISQFVRDQGESAT